MRRPFPVLLLLPMLAVARAQAPTAVAAPAMPTPGMPISDLAPITVTGVQPGPGMWQVRKGDHVLWVLGTLSPLPRTIDWRPVQLQQVIDQADEILAEPAMVVDADIGWFRGLTLVPAMLRARDNPDGRALHEVVPPADYARWQVLKARYLGNDRGVERRRPILAAQALYQAAVKRTGLAFDDPIRPYVAKAAKARGLSVQPVQVKVMLADPKKVLRELQTTSLDDGPCFSRMLTRIESDIGQMGARANAWAIGDVDALRGLPATSTYAVCMDAVMGSSIGRKIGATDLRQRTEQAWIDRAVASLEKNRVTLAMLPMATVLDATGPVERLRSLGYEVLEP